ncbi:MAG: hypothetical protein GY771_14115 [bacterium]|nr:hypothetical protein [bacterium]
MIYNDTDYVKAVKLLVKDLIETEFGGTAVYLYDPDNLPDFGDEGTFCIEGLASGVNTGPPAGQVYVTLRIWTYYRELDNELAEERVSGSARKLEGVLLAASSSGPTALSDLVGTDFIQTTYLTRQKGRTLRRKYLRAARTDWRVRLSATR